jgi:hypothetical protein
MTRMTNHSKYTRYYRRLVTLRVTIIHRDTPTLVLDFNNPLGTTQVG